MRGDLDGLLVVSVEQAVAAPYASGRLADAGARVIKVERPEGDFARRYDRYVNGESAYFVWLNRGKESVALDLKAKADLALLHRMIERADIVIQNLAPGAAGRLGIDNAALTARHPALIACAISGYGEHGPMARQKAYDLLVQAETGLAAHQRHARGTGPGRRLGHRHRRRDDRVPGDPSGADRPRPHRSGARHRGLALPCHRGLDERALSAAPLRWAHTGPIRPRTPDHRALWRLCLRLRPGRAVLDPERARVAKSLRACAGRGGDRDGCALRHQSGSGGQPRGAR